MKKETLMPQMIRIEPSLKFLVHQSANIFNGGNFNQETRDLIRIGLENRKKGVGNKAKRLNR